MSISDFGAIELNEAFATQALATQALATMCVGVGQGAALAVERI